jgi:DNA-binding HxlR family transcriptional regulator
MSVPPAPAGRVPSRAQAHQIPRASRAAGNPGKAGKLVGKPVGPPGGCAIGDLFGLLSQTHVLDILYLVNHTDGPVRFVELQERLKVSPNTLSARLKRLVQAGLLSRTAHNTIPPRVDYEATAKARDLANVFRSLDQWSQVHNLHATP